MIPIKKLFPLAFVLLALLAVCAPPVKMKVLISMIEDQEKYFREVVSPEFGKTNNADIAAIHFGSTDSIPMYLQENAGAVSLVKIPFDKGWSLIRKGLIKPLDSFLTPEDLKEFHDTYLLTSLCTEDEHTYYVPRKFETRVMVYLKSKVDDAAASWRQYRDSIDADLRAYNGYGLPATFVLENDPNKWDYFDIFAAGWIWAHTPYNGKKSPRIAHRGKRYSGTALRVIDRIYQCGGAEKNVLEMDGDAVADAFHWEAVYSAAGIYNPRMWEEGWSGVGVWGGFRENEVFLSFMTQLDCFFIHGTGSEGLKGYLDNPEDMGVAVMPAGCSVDLDAAGNVLRTGTKAITTGGWWWGIPDDSPDPKLSYSLARFIAGTSNQVQECSRFGMIPVRKDILSDMSMLFGGGWISGMYETSFRQLMQNKNTVIPNHPNFDRIQNVYLDAWFGMVVGKNWSADRKIPDREYIYNLLKSEYTPKVTALQ